MQQGLRTDELRTIRFQIKDGVTFSRDGLGVAIDDNGQAALPGGDADLFTIGVTADAGTGVGDDDNPQFVDVYINPPSVKAIAGAAIVAGKTCVTKGTAGKWMNGTTAGAVVLRALTPAAADGDEFYATGA